MKLERQDQAGILYIDTDRNNAINDEFIREAHQLMDEAERDPAIRALVVTSTHKTLFCPGVDLPSLMGRSAPEMRRFYEALTGIMRRKVTYPKPEVYALNGHTIAGGCMMALAGDYRLMVKGRFSFGLMEVDVGLAAPIGVVEMIRHIVGGRVAERMLFSIICTNSASNWRAASWVTAPASVPARARSSARPAKSVAVCGAWTAGVGMPMEAMRCCLLDH